MGLSRTLLRLLWPAPKRPTRVLMLGLDGAGKTTLLYKMRLGDVVTTIPTIGFNVEQVTFGNLTMDVWDVGGQSKIRALWRHYYEHTEALVFVVDSNDRERLADARDELLGVLGDDRLLRVPVLVLVNKQDLPEAASAAEVCETLQLAMLTQKWYVQPCCATTGDGLTEGMRWLCDRLAAAD